MSDTLTTLREKVEQLPTEPLLVVSRTNPFDVREVCGLVPEDDVLALLSSLPPSPEPGTCATCKHWCAGKLQGESMREAYVRNAWAAECGRQGEFRSMFTIYIYSDGRVDGYDFDTPPTFGCTLHEPAPKEPQP